MRRKIGWMGGSFDPIHNVHLMLAEQAKELLSLDEIWWIPANQSPHKMAAPTISPSERLELVQLAIQNLDHHQLFDLEVRRAGISYTMDTVLEMMNLYPNTDFYILLGADQIQALPRWHRIDELMKLVWFVCTARPGYMDLNLIMNDPSWSRDWRDRLIIVDMPQLDVSSSEIRARLLDGRSIVGWVPESVQSRIEERGYYGRRTRTTN